MIINPKMSLLPVLSFFGYLRLLSVMMNFCISPLGLNYFLPALICPSLCYILGFCVCDACLVLFGLGFLEVSSGEVFSLSPCQLSFKTSANE
jgi:hypothetical protein